MQTNDQILVGESGEKVFISVEGRGNFQNSHPMKEYALAMLDQGKKTFIVNLKQCSGMDSTFMGVLAGLAIRLRKSEGAKLRLIHVSPHNKELLETLGLSQLVEIVETLEESASPVSPLPATDPNKTQVATHMLEAHQTLSDLSEINQIKFKNVIHYIKENLGKKTE
jgi:anti-anti-sigma factor